VGCVATRRIGPSHANFAVKIGQGVSWLSPETSLKHMGVVVGFERTPSGLQVHSCASVHDTASFICDLHTGCANDSVPPAGQHNFPIFRYRTRHREIVFGTA
jgi:hypothetical protein